MINIDADGVLVNWRDYVLGTHFPDMDIETLNGLNPDERTRLLRSMYESDPQLFYKLEPLPGAVELIEWIKLTGEPWRVLTSSGTDHPDYDVAKASKIANLTKLFDIDESKIVVTRTSAEKASYCECENDILVDDYHRNISEWCNAGGVGILVEENYDHKNIISMIEFYIDMVAL